MRTPTGKWNLARVGWLFLLAGGCGGAGGKSSGTGRPDSSTFDGGGVGQGDGPRDQPGSAGGGGGADRPFEGMGADRGAPGSGDSAAGGSAAGGSAAGGSAAGGSAVGGAGGTTPLAGPLVVSTTNPRYFQDASGRALILVGSHTWDNLQDWGAAGVPQAFDFGAYTKFLVQHGHNFTLLWRTELPKFCGLPTTDTAAPDLTTSPHPWPRTGPGTASDGGLKFDLSRFDPTYFDRLRSRVMQLHAAGIWVGVYLFTGEWLNVYRCAGDGFPLTGGNNVNAIDDAGGNGSMTMKAENALTAIEDAMADKTVDTLNDLPNVLWIVSEEAAGTTTWWQGHMIAHVRGYEAAKPHHHPIGLAVLAGGPDSTIYDSDADWVAPVAQLSPSTTCGNGTPKCKVNINDSDHSYFGMWNDSAQKNRQYAWENFARGNQVIFMDPYDVSYPRQNRNLCPSPKNAICAGPDARWNNFRDNMGYILSYSRRLNLNVAQPSTTLCSTTYCLGQTPAVGTEMVVYAPTGGTFTVDLGQSSGRTMNYEWFDPATGQIVSKGSVPGGNAKQSFSTPASVVGDSVLYIVDAAGHA
jgi:Putative collagen-binding domain of a collagenase